MKDAEHTIERLLAGLRDAKPAAGMERRILEVLDGVERHEASTFASSWHRPSRPAIAMLLACTVTLMVAITLRQHRHAPADLSHSTRADVRPATRPDLVRKVPTLPRRTASPVPVKRPHHTPAAAQTASFPAPPLPLTEQERLLLRLAHRGDADNMAILNPDARAAQTAKAAEEFQQFFSINATEMRSESE